MRRRAGRRIEIWFANAASAEVRKKGPSYGTRWDPADVVELEIKLETDHDVPKFYLYGGPRIEAFDGLKLARVRVKELAVELADERANENWREVILVGGYHEDLSVFEYTFSRALVCEKRVRYWTDSAYGKAETLNRSSYEVEFDARLWAELETMVELEKWFDGIRGRRDWSNEDDPDEDFGVEILFRYLRGRARALRDLKEGKTVRVPR